MRFAAACKASMITAALVAGIPALIVGYEHAIWRFVQGAETRRPWLRLPLELAWLRSRRRPWAQL